MDETRISGAELRALRSWLSQRAHQLVTSVDRNVYWAWTLTCPLGADCARDALGERFGIYLVLFHLNDEHKWSRERIADWLDTFDIPVMVGP